jgi:hypothetical protein
MLLAVAQSRRRGPTPSGFGGWRTPGIRSWAAREGLLTKLFRYRYPFS